MDRRVYVIMKVLCNGIQRQAKTPSTHCQSTEHGQFGLTVLHQFACLAFFANRSTRGDVMRCFPGFGTRIISHQTHALSFHRVRAMTCNPPPAKKPKTMSPRISSPASAPTVPPKSPEQLSLLVQKLSPKGRLPTRGSPMSAGYDLYS